ncbi:MAG TPA: folate-binding protein [Acetobacteraceae bacterium]|nr:folate-binding protein [Acetobacteraceae bacterium]
MVFLALLPERGVLSVAGEDRREFLQGLVSNDVAGAAPGRAVWAALLTPQGKWLADFFILADGERLLLDCERGQIPMLLARLRRFRLRARVSVEDVSDELAVYGAWGGAPEIGDWVVAAPDPRLEEAGWRLLSSAPLAANASFEEWDLHRLSLGLPDGSRDLEAERTLLLEAGFDELAGVSWTKGCYMGQELTARTRYRGLIKRRLMPVAVAGPLPAPETPVLAAGVVRGAMRSGRGELGLASLRLDALAEKLMCGEAVLTPRTPPWLRLPS